MKDRNIEDFEFSQGYLFFWDKVERSNYFLNTIADSYCREPKEDVGGRLVSFLLGNPICDGGQWDMVVNLIEKHGEFFSSTKVMGEDEGSHTERLCWLLSFRRPYNCTF